MRLPEDREKMLADLDTTLSASVRLRIYDKAALYVAAGCEGRITQELIQSLCDYYQKSPASLLELLRDAHTQPAGNRWEWLGALRQTVEESVTVEDTLSYLDLAIDAIRFWYLGEKEDNPWSDPYKYRIVDNPSQDIAYPVSEHLYAVQALFCIPLSSDYEFGEVDPDFVKDVSERLRSISDEIIIPLMMILRDHLHNK